MQEPLPLSPAEEYPGAADGGSNRERILSAAIHAFGEHGYGGASTNQICAAAGISKGLLFHYFKSKENLFMAVLEKCEEDFIQSMRHDENMGKLSLESLAAFYQKQADFFSRNPHHYHILTQLPQGNSEALDAFVSKKKEEFMSALSLGLRLYLSRSPVRPGVDREVALEIITGLVVNLQDKYIAAVSRGEFPLNEIIRMMERDFLAAVDIISHGILLPGKTENL